MTEADKLFKELGYRITLDNEYTLIYEHSTEFFKINITFDKRDYKKTVHAIEGQWIPKNSETWVAQKFNSEFEKYSSANGYWSSMWHEFTMQELKAINMKCKELGWLDE